MQAHHVRMTHHLHNWNLTLDLQTITNPGIFTRAPNRLNSELARNFVCSVFLLKSPYLFHHLVTKNGVFRQHFDRKKAARVGIDGEFDFGESACADRASQCILAYSSHALPRSIRLSEIGAWNGKLVLRGNCRMPTSGELKKTTSSPTPHSCERDFRLIIRDLDEGFCWRGEFLFVLVLFPFVEYIMDKEAVQSWQTKMRIVRVPNRLLN